jgi:type VI secretion system secreted protein VgrG
MAIPQLYRPIAIGTPLGDDVLAVKSLRACEPLGRPFRLDLELLSEDDAIDFDSIVGENVTVRLETTRGSTRFFNGIVSDFAQCPAEGRTARYRATVVPWLWLLTRTSDCRIFQGKSVPEIIKEVFHDHGLADYDDRLAGAYPEREYCVQYRETDFAFVSRLMEAEGIYYFFEHDDGRHTLVLADGPAAHEPFAGYETIAYRPPSSGSSDIEHIRSWTVRKRVQPGGYALNAFDFQNPKKSLHTLSKMHRGHAWSGFEMYDYPGRYTEYDDGERYARLRLEEFHAQHEAVEGESDARGIAAGYSFELTDHPRDDQCREYLVTSTTLTVEADAYESTSPGTHELPFWHCTFTAIDATTTFRPLRATPQPRIEGPQTAIVTGSADEEIYTDEYGRVKVQFHWDRYGEADEMSSCWIRVAQSWAGKKWGAMFLPRVGQEVIVEFLEGDPDRPIITGRVYNGSLMPPYELPGNKTLSTVKSNSSKGGRGFNEIRLEDKKDEEQIFIHAQKNQDVRVNNDCFETVGNNRHLVVKKDQFEHVGNNRHAIVDADHMEEIGKDRHLRVNGKEAKDVAGSHSFTVQGDVIEVFKANHSEEAAQGLFLKAMNVQIEAMAEIELKCGGSSIVLTPAAIYIVGGPLVNINSGSGPPVVKPPLNAAPPASPTAAEEADDADPGEVAKIKAQQRQSGAGKYGAAHVEPYSPDEEKTSWVEIELVGEDESPIPGERYRVELPDGTVAEGTLDENGCARVDGIDPGNCNITFPNLDQDAWERD